MNSSTPDPETQAVRQNGRVRPLRLSDLSYVTAEQAQHLRRLASAYTLSPVSQELIELLASLGPLDRFYRAVRVVMFLLREESLEEVPEPCLAAEEQFMLDEILRKSLPREAQRVAAGLLHVVERPPIARVFSRAVNTLQEINDG